MSDVPPYGSQPPPPGGGSSAYPPPPPSGYPPPPPPGYPPPPPPSGYPPPPPFGGYTPPPGYQQPESYYPAGSPGGSPSGALAEWPQRALGLVIDGAIGAALFLGAVILGLILSTVSTSLLVLAYIIGFLAAIGWQVFVAVQIGQTGASPGMRVAGLRCVGKATGTPIGAGMSVVRFLVNFGFGALCGILALLDVLFPLWDPEKQTLHDKVVNSVVVTAPKQSFSLQPSAGSY